jgi:hypothetical protein
MMVDMTQAFTEATNNIRTWRNRYSADEYPHKVVINMMYRAYTMRQVWKDFMFGRLPRFNNYTTAIGEMEKFNRSSNQQRRKLDSEQRGPRSL